MPAIDLLKAAFRKTGVDDIAPPRLSFTDFKRRMYRRYQHAPHLEVLDAHLSEVVRYIESGGKSGIGRLIVEMPPRHGKTMTSSKLFPSFFLAYHPDMRIINVSYGADLSEKSSRFARNLINAPAFQAIAPGVRLAEDSKSVSAWDIAGHEGGMDAIGIGGAATGKGSHLLNLDDLVKNREQAESKTWRDKVWDSYTDDLYTRLEPGGAVIMTGTRWHVDDHIGRVLKQEGDKWTRLRLPALAEDDDLLGREVGAALWPERYPLETLRDIQATLGEYAWAALYQQRPTPSEGGIFKRAWFEPLLDNEPPMVYKARYWDLAMSSKTGADYTAGVEIGQGEDGHFYILDVERERIDWAELVPRIANVIIRDGASVPQGIEAKGYMSRAIQELNADARMRHYSIIGFDVDTDKLTRALPFAARCGAGLVHVLNRHWTQEFLDELCSFPNSAHDDQVDAAAGAYTMLGEAVGALYGAVSHQGANYGAIGS